MENKNLKLKEKKSRYEKLCLGNIFTSEINLNYDLQDFSGICLKILELLNHSSSREIFDSEVITNFHEAERMYLAEAIENSFGQEGFLENYKQLKLINLELSLNKLMESDLGMNEKRSSIFQIFSKIAQVNDPRKSNQEIIQELMDSIFNKRDYLTMSCGLPIFDKECGKLRAGEFITIAARTGVGKTSFLINLIASNLGVATYINSLEMNRMDNFKRLLSRMSLEKNLKYSPIEMELKVPTPVQGEILAEVGGRMAELGIFFTSDDGGEPDIDMFIAEAIHHIQNFGVQLVCVDYIQLMNGSNPKSSIREQVIDITRKLKRLAMEYQIIVVALCQAKRESTAGAYPTLSDLQESASIEQGSDKVFMLHCPEVIDEKGNKKYLYNKMNIAILKNRRGKKYATEVDVDLAYSKYF